MVRAGGCEVSGFTLHVSCRMSHMSYFRFMFQGLAGEQGPGVRILGSSVQWSGLTSRVYGSELSEEWGVGCQVPPSQGLKVQGLELSRCGQSSRISHIPGGWRPLLRESGPISCEARSSASACGESVHCAGCEVQGVGLRTSASRAPCEAWRRVLMSSLARPSTATARTAATPLSCSSADTCRRV